MHVQSSRMLDLAELRSEVTTHTDMTDSVGILTLSCRRNHCRQVNLRFTDDVYQQRVRQIQILYWTTRT